MQEKERESGFVKQVTSKIKQDESASLDMAAEVADYLKQHLPNRPEEREQLKDDIEHIARDAARGVRLQTSEGLIQPVGARGTIPAQSMQGIDRDFNYITTDFKEDPECAWAIEIQGLVTHEEAEAILKNTPGRDAVNMDEVSSGDTFPDVEGDALTIAAMGEGTCMIRMYTAPTPPIIEAMQAAANDDSPNNR